MTNALAIFALALFSCACVLCASAGNPCCSWNKCGACGKTTAYCNQESHCSSDCGGEWCPAGASAAGAGYDTPSSCGKPPAGNPGAVAYACLDWNVGSGAMDAAAAAEGGSTVIVTGLVVCEA